MSAVANAVVSSSNHAVAVEMIIRGFRVLPCWECKGPGPSDKMKSPRNAGGHLSASLDPDQVERWWNQWPNALVGIDLPTAGIFAIDADRHGGPDGVAEWEAIARLYGDVGPGTVPYVNTPSGGLHAYFRRPEGMQASNRTGNLPAGIDVRCAGYTIAPGCVMPDGSAYAPVDGSPPVSLDMPVGPAWLVELIGTSSRPQEPHSREPLVSWDGEAEIERAMQILDAHTGAVEGAGGNGATYALACRLRALGLSEARTIELMSENWNEKCSPPWPMDEFIQVIENAYRYGLGAPGAQSPRYVYAGIDFADSAALPKSPLEKRLMRQGDALKHGTWLLKHLIPRTGTALLVAPSGAGKTSVAGQLAKSLAMGTPFFGKPVKEKCGTLILAAEGLSGLQARLNVLDPLGGLPVYALPMVSLGSEKAFSEIRADIQQVAAICLAEHGLRLGLVIIDTLAASGLLTNENDNSECAAAIKKLERLALDAGCLVMAMHHSPKVGSDPRGGSALGAGVDLILTVTRNGQAVVRSLHCTKGRDSREGPLGSFTLVPENVGRDEDGDEITACTVSMSEAPSPLIATPIHLPPTDEQTAEISERIDEGAPDGHPWRFAFSSHDSGDNWAGVPIGDVMGFVAQGTEERSTAQAILKEMIAGGNLVKGDRKDPAAPKNSQRKPVPFVKLP